jgi:hypothetical protein
MKNLRAIAVVLILVILLAACGGGGSSPTAAVKGFFQAFAKLDVDKMTALTCSEMAEEMEETLGVFALFGDGVKIDVSGLKYEVVEESGDRAVVRVTGTMKMSVSELGIDESTEMDEEMPVVKEGGEWKVCGDF